MIKLVFFILLILILPLGVSAKEPKTVIVGIYPWSPYVNYYPSSTGVSIEFVKLLNSFQKDFKFVTKEIPAKRRYDLIKNGTVDIILFEDANWDWKGRDVLFSNQFAIKGVPYKDGELFVALKEKTTDQKYFDNLKDKKILITLGYHYAFTNFSTDDNYLKKHFDLDICPDPEGIIKKLLKNRGDIGLISQSLLKQYTLKNPQDKDKFFIATKMDSVYSLLIVIRKNGSISKNQIDFILDKLDKDGLAEKFFKEQHLID